MHIKIIFIIPQLKKTKRINKSKTKIHHIGQPAISTTNKQRMGGVYGQFIKEHKNKYRIKCYFRDFLVSIKRNNQCQKNRKENTKSISENSIEWKQKHQRTPNIIHGNIMT